MHRIFRVKAYEAEHGPHFNEEHARKAVSKMENEDGTRGPHWSVEETTALASQYGINLGSRFNRYDWFVALNMVYSDYYMPNQPRKKVVDITIQCNGETKKFTIPENKSVITDNSIGLTISTDKQEIINIVRNQYDTYKQRKEAIAKCDEEMAKCQVLLDKLGVDNEPARENDKILELQKEVSELKNIIRKANQMVPPPMKEMLPQDMKNAMDKVGQ